MQISSVASSSAASALQKLLASIKAQSAETTGQDVPGGAQGAERPSGPPPGGPPPGPPPSGGASSQFASSTLASLLDAQEDDGTTSDIAGLITDSLDTNGDGTLSLDEIDRALGDSKTDRTSAFAKLDVSGDGQLDVAELTKALDTFQTRQVQRWSSASDAQASSLDVSA